MFTYLLLQSHISNTGGRAIYEDGSVFFLHFVYIQWNEPLHFPMLISITNVYFGLVLMNIP